MCGKRDKFKPRDDVRVAKSETLVNKPKKCKWRFFTELKFLNDCGEDSYLVRMGETGEIVKKIHYDLKLII